MRRVLFTLVVLSLAGGCAARQKVVILHVGIECREPAPDVQECWPVPKPAPKPLSCIRLEADYRSECEGSSMTLELVK